jgi:hypothetical protein
MWSLAAGTASSERRNSAFLDVTGRLPSQHTPGMQILDVAAAQAE